MPKAQTLPEWKDSRDYKHAQYAAEKALDEPWADPDDDLRTISRQFIRMTERYDHLETQLSTQKAEMVKKVIEERTKIAQISATKISRGWVVAQFDDLLDTLNTK